MENKIYKETREFLSDIEDINCGGCLFAAYAIYLVLKKHNILPETFALVALNGTEYQDNHITNLHFLSDLTKKATSSNHFGWTFDGGRTVYDTDSQLDLNKYKHQLIIPQHKIEQFCKSALFDCSKWAYWFDRKTQLPIIEEKLGISF